jgi:hypothetical protein
VWPRGRGGGGRRRVVGNFLYIIYAGHMFLCETGGRTIAMSAIPLLKNEQNDTTHKEW